MPARPERQRLPPVAVSLPIAGAFVIAATLWATPFAAFCALLGIVVVALAGLAVLRRLDTAEPGRRAALFALGPCVLFGAGLADLNDSLWMAACLMALAAALDRRHILMLLCWGGALGIDPQAMFVAPFFLALLIDRRVPVYRWAVAPLVAAATLAARFAAGWPIGGWACAFCLQADGVQQLSANAPNIWTIVQVLPLGEVPLSGLALAATIGVSGAYVARISTLRLSGHSLVAAALLASLIMAGLLPHLHPNGVFLADMLVLILALSKRDPASGRIALLVQAGSALGVLADLSGLGGLAILGAGALVTATLSLARSVLKPAANDNPLMARQPART